MLCEMEMNLKFAHNLQVVVSRYGRTITNQLKRLGASCDWSRDHFTLDEQLSRKSILVPINSFF